MKKFLLKNRIVWGLACLVVLSLGPLSTPAPMHAAIPGGTLSEEEIQHISSLMQQVREYTDRIRAVTGDLFTRSTPFSQDLNTQIELRNLIISIHNTINRTGSPLSQAILAHLKGLAHQLSEAQIKWVTTLQSKSLLTMGRNRGFMSERHNDSQRFLLGAKQGHHHSGDGLIGCLEVTGNTSLRDHGQALLINVEFIFHYAQATHRKEIDLALHLIKYKGFHPRFIKQIAWLLK